MRKIPFHDLLNATLQALHELGDSAINQEIHDKAAVILQLSEAEIAKPHKPNQSWPTDLSYRLSWARTHLKRYGLLQNSSRGVWALTDKGKTVSSVDGKEVERVVNEQLRIEKNSRGATHESGAGETDENIQEILETDNDPTIESEWRDTLYTVLTEMHPSAFERLCQRMLRESGFSQVEVTGRSGDGGIDGIGILRLGGFLSIRVLFQCKRYSGSIGPGAVRDFRGAMIGRTDKGLIVTTANFTRDAMREATRDGAPEIDLVDGEQLIDKLKELSLGVKTEEIVVERVTIDADFFNSI